MSYRNKTYVIFKGSDIHNYRLMSAWKNNQYIDFNFFDAHDIQPIQWAQNEAYVKSILLDRIQNSKQVIVLIGSETYLAHKYVEWEIKKSIDLDIPIVAVNLNQSRKYVFNRCPLVLDNHIAPHVSFQPKIIKYALDDYCQYYSYYKSKYSGPFDYSDSVYSSLSL